MEREDLLSASRGRCEGWGQSLVRQPLEMWALCSVKQPNFFYWLSHPSLDVTKRFLSCFSFETWSLFYISVFRAKFSYLSIQSSFFLSNCELYWNTAFVQYTLWMCVVYFHSMSTPMHLNSESEENFPVSQGIPFSDSSCSSTKSLFLLASGSFIHGSKQNTFLCAWKVFLPESPPGHLFFFFFEWIPIMLIITKWSLRWPICQPTGWRELATWT